VVYELPRLPARSGETGPINGIVQSAFEQEQQVFTCDALHARRAFKVISKLTFEDEVDAFDLLLLAQLLAIANQGLTAAQRITVLPGRLRATLFNGARGFVASITFEKKLCTFAATQSAHRVSIPSQLFSCLQSVRRKSLQAALAALALHPLPFQIFDF